MERKVTRLYTGTDGESHFEDMKMPLIEQKDGWSWHSESIKATSIIFVESARDFYKDWHNAPRRQFIITLDGRGEIEVGDGTKRQFGPGDILLVEDTTGRGHITRGMSNQPRKTVFVPLD